jgi:hypothetical protein
VNGLRIPLGVDEQGLAASGVAYDTDDEVVVAVTGDTRVLRSERRGRAPNDEDDNGDPADQRRVAPLTCCSSAGIVYGAAPATGGRSHIVPTTPTEPSMREFRHGSPPRVRIAMRSDWSEDIQGENPVFELQMRNPLESRCVPTGRSTLSEIRWAQRIR